MRARGTGLTGIFAILLSISTNHLAAAPSRNAAGPAKAPATKSKGDDDNPHVWRTRSTSVSVFKNGLGFFVREGSVALQDRWCLAGDVPPAAFGTLAIYALDPKEIVDIVGSGPGAP